MKLTKKDILEDIKVFENEINAENPEILCASICSHFAKKQTQYSHKKIGTCELFALYFNEIAQNQSFDCTCEVLEHNANGVKLYTCLINNNLNEKKSFNYDVIGKIAEITKKMLIKI